MGCAPRTSQVFLAYGAGIGLAMLLCSAPPAASASPPVLSDYLRACGIGENDFRRFSDDRQMAGEELDVVRRIAVRLRDCPADVLRKMAARQNAAAKSLSGDFPLPAAAKNECGRPLRFLGRVESIDVLSETPASDATEPLWRCTIAREVSPRKVIVYGTFPTDGFGEDQRSRQTANLPAVGAAVVADAVFVKNVPGVKDQWVPVVVVPRLQRRAAGYLAELDFDPALFEEVADGRPLTSADSAAFYRLLALTGTADAAALRRDAPLLDATAAAKLFGDPVALRGSLFHIVGDARRVVRVPIADPAAAARLGADHYFQVDLLSAAAQDNPLVFCTLSLPPNMPLGLPPSYRQPIEGTGFFLKTWQYPTPMTAAEQAAHPNASRAIQTAPLFVGPPPQWKPPMPSENSLGWTGGGLLALAATGLGLLLWSLRQSDQEFSDVLRQAFTPLRNQL